jgi:hypothetical protein
MIEASSRETVSDTHLKNLYTMVPTICFNIQRYDFIKDSDKWNL